MSIVVNNIKFNYGSKIILDRISFQIEHNCLVSVLGANGVGKSTLFRCMLGIQKGYTGEIIINGMNIRNISAKLLAENIAYIPQSHIPTFNYSALDVVLMGATSQSGFFGVPKKEHKKQAMLALETLHIAHLASRGYLNISGGERQLVLIARALAQQAKVLIMDEPTSNLDYGNQIRVLELVKELSRNGYTIIQSIHNPEQAFLYADQVLVLKEGKVEDIGTPNEVLDKTLIKKIYNINVELYDLCFGKVRVCVPSTAAI